MGETAEIREYRVMKAPLRVLVQILSAVGVTVVFLAVH